MRTQRPEAAERLGAPKCVEDVEVNIGGVALQFAILEGGMRVVVAPELMRALGIYRSGALSTRRKECSEVHFPLFLAFKNLWSLALQDKGLVRYLHQPTQYRRNNGRGDCVSIPVLRQVLNVWVRAAEAQILGPRQMRIAKRAQSLLQGLDSHSIDALIEEQMRRKSKRKR